MNRSRPAFAASLLLNLIALASASAREVPLSELPSDKLALMAPLLRHGEVALIESKSNGQMKQVTIMALVAAPPDVLRQVVTTPEKWPEFIPGLTRSNVAHHPDGSLDYDFAMDLKFTTLSTNNRMVPRPDGAIYVWDNNPNDETTMRWQFIGVAGGTVMVQYGYSDVLHANKWIQRVVKAAPLMEHGLAVAGQFAYVRAMKARAEKLAKPGSFAVADPKAAGPGFKFLLERGRVAVIRSTPAGRLADISILDSFMAAESKVEEVLLKPSEYSKFIDGVKKSYEVKRDGAAIVYETEFDLSILTFSTRWEMRKNGNAVEAYAISGDRRGAHYRWDLTTRGAKETTVVYRSNEDLASASPLILGSVFRTVPSFEHGIAVALGLVNVVGVRGRAEGKR